MYFIIVYFSCPLTATLWDVQYFLPGHLSSLTWFLHSILSSTLYCTDASYSHRYAALVPFTTWTKSSSGFFQIAVVLPKLSNGQWTSDTVMETVKEMKLFFLGFTTHLFLPFSAVREIDLAVVPPTWVRQSGQAFHSPCLHLGGECKEV